MGHYILNTQYKETVGYWLVVRNLAATSGKNEDSSLVPSTGLCFDNNFLSASNFSIQVVNPAYFTVCPRSSDPFYVVSYYIKWVTTSWTHSMKLRLKYAKKVLPFFFTQQVSIYKWPGLLGHPVCLNKSWIMN